MKFLILKLSLFFSLLSACAQNSNNKPINDTIKHKMKIEIWSDIACPFCYIGKYKLDKALSNLSYKDSIEVVWKSFQLTPELKTDTSKSLYQSLAETKGITIAYAQQMTSNVLEMGKNNGIYFNFDKTIPANTFNAHVLLHFCAKYNKQSAAKEKLFEAYFLEGKNIDDITVLTTIASELKIDTMAWTNAFNNKLYNKDVIADMQEASKMQISGVPYFIFDKKYAISGAQNDDVFTNTLNKAYLEFMQKNTDKNSLQTTEGAVCTPKECK